MTRIAMVVVLGLMACKKDGDGEDAGFDDTSDTGPLAAGGWAEPNWCGDMEDLSDLEAAYNATNLRNTLVAVSERRYPPGVELIAAMNDAELARWFAGATGSFDDMIVRYEVAVHEGAHYWGLNRLSFDGYHYRVVDDDVTFELPYLDNFNRSEILSRHPDAANDFYANTYLTGASGAQGFNTLLDEYNAYTHSLVSRHCTRDTLPPGASTSARDGILTFMWYVETYLKIAREEHSADYQAIVNDPAHVELILTVWERAEHWLEVTSDIPGLGINDDALQVRVYEPGNLEEIDRLRE